MGGVQKENTFEFIFGYFQQWVYTGVHACIDGTLNWKIIFFYNRLDCWFLFKILVIKKNNCDIISRLNQKELPKF